MRSFWIRIALLLTALAVVVIATVQPDLIANLPPSSVLQRCVRDPVGLPVPVGPDQRPANFLHTCGGKLYDRLGREVKIAGLSWSGMENGGFAPGGLDRRNWLDLLDQVAELGYNTIRVPFSSDTFQAGWRVNGINGTLNPGLEGLTGLQMLDHLIAAARDRGLKVILDRHFVSSGRLTTLWYTEDVSEDRWLSDWRMLAARYYGNDTVIAADLHNEPHGEATWGTGDPSTDWRMAAEKAGNAVQEVNPYLLIFVEGIENYDKDHWWWGGDLQGVRSAPVRLRVSNRLVYSPHDYGPAINEQAWFWNPRFPANLPEEWDRRWGYIQQHSIAPVVVGEFGGRSVGADRDGRWQRALLSYLKTHNMGALVWSLNPGWDTGGILAEDWRTVERAKQEAYQQLLGLPVVGGTTSGVESPARYQVLYQQGDTDEQGSNVTFSLQIVNDGHGPIGLSRFEARYWLTGGGSPARDEQRLQVETVDMPAQHVRVDLVSTEQGGQDHYLRIGFDQGAGNIGRYQGSGKVIVRFRKSDQGNGPRARDYSYASAPELHKWLGEWDRVTLYLDGKLVWGREP